MKRARSVCLLLVALTGSACRGKEEAESKSSAPQPIRVKVTAVVKGSIREQLEAGSNDLYAEALAVMERQLVTAILRHVGGNQLQAAKILGITRGSLRNKMRTLGITIERSVETSTEGEP